MSSDATEAEIEFLKSLKFRGNRPRALYYYRELQSLRDPLHFAEVPATPANGRRDFSRVDKQAQLDSRKKAIQRWAKNKPNPRKKDSADRPLRSSWSK